MLGRKRKRVRDRNNTHWRRIGVMSVELLITALRRGSEKTPLGRSAAVLVGDSGEHMVVKEVTTNRTGQVLIKLEQPWESMARQGGQERPRWGEKLDDYDTEDAPII